MTVTTPDSKGGLAGCDFAPFDVILRTEGSSSWVIDVRGELDLYTGPMLKQQVLAYEKLSGGAGKPRNIVFSLPGLGFIDASGLRALLTAVEGHGTETITIREPSSVVRRLFELVGLGSMIEQENSLLERIAAPAPGGFLTMPIGEPG